jgi:hypothetical protein
VRRNLLANTEMILRIIEALIEIILALLNTFGAVILGALTPIILIVATMVLYAFIFGKKIAFLIGFPLGTTLSTLSTVLLIRHLPSSNFKTGILIYDVSSTLAGNMADLLVGQWLNDFPTWLIVLIVILILGLPLFFHFHSNQRE